MRKAKSIRELYDEVTSGGFDCVLTVDAPLATALNSMDEQPRLGGFAFTPRQIAEIESSHILRTRSLSDLEVISAIKEETGYDLRFIYSEVKNIRDIRRYTADVLKYLYTARARKVYESYTALPTTERVMNDYDVDDVNGFFASREKVAVIGLDLFDDLDKHFIPHGKFEEIDLFTPEPYTIPEIRAIGNDRQIAAALVDLIDPEKADDYAFVLDPHGRVGDAVRSALYRRKIPFKNTMDVRDLSQVRDFLQFVDLALDYSTIRVRDVRELFSAYQAGTRGGLRPQWDNYLLSKAESLDITDEITLSLLHVMKNIREMTFGEAADSIMKGRKTQKPQVTMLLEDLKVVDRRIDPGILIEVTYAVDNVEDLKHNEQTPPEERRGVLLADCGNSVYLDRPVVFYIGIDSTWDISVAGKDYANYMDQEEKDAIRLSVLLQQGDRRVYAVKPATDGRPTNPCQTLEAIEELEGRPRKISTFSDLCGEENVVYGSWVEEEGDGRLTKDPVEPREPDADWNFSKSSYNNFIDCPIAFLFNKLVGGEDNEYTVFGNCLHDFAEMYLCYPNTVKENGVESYVDRLDAIYSGMSNTCMTEIDRCNLRVGIQNLTRYIDSIRPASVPLDMENSPKMRKYPNNLISDAGKRHCSSLAENEMTSDKKLFAKYDFCFGDRIVDYKTGRMKTPKDILKAFDPNDKGHSEYQPLIYLAVLLANRHSLPLEFDLFYATANDISSSEEHFDVGDNVVKIIFIDRKAHELLLNDETPEYLGISKLFKPKWKELITALGERISRPGLVNVEN